MYSSKGVAWLGGSIHNPTANKIIQRAMMSYVYFLMFELQPPMWSTILSNPFRFVAESAIWFSLLPIRIYSITIFLLPYYFLKGLLRRIVDYTDPTRGDEINGKRAPIELSLPTERDINRLEESLHTLRAHTENTLVAATETLNRRRFDSSRPSSDATILNAAESAADNASRLSLTAPSAASSFIASATSSYSRLISEPLSRTLYRSPSRSSLSTLASRRGGEDDHDDEYSDGSSRTPFTVTPATSLTPFGALTAPMSAINTVYQPSSGLAAGRNTGGGLIGRSSSFSATGDATSSRMSSGMLSASNTIASSALPVSGSAPILSRVGLVSIMEETAEASTSPRDETSSESAPHLNLPGLAQPSSSAYADVKSFVNRLYILNLLAQVAQIAVVHHYAEFLKPILPPAAVKIGILGFLPIGLACLLCFSVLMRKDFPLNIFVLIQNSFITGGLVGGLLLASLSQLPQDADYSLLALMTLGSNFIATWFDTNAGPSK